MKNTLIRTINMLRNASGKEVFDQICAVCWLQHDIIELKTNKSLKDNVAIKKDLQEVYHIAVLVEKSQCSREVNKYLIECCIFRLSEINKKVLSLE